MNKIKNTLFVFLFLMILPVGVFASSYSTLNLEETFLREKLEYDVTNYQESDEQITIYMFRGQGCSYCRQFLTFLNSILPEYGKYFKLVSFEVWQNKNNAALMNDVADSLKQNISGVPFIVIGDKVFTGYSNTFDDQIKKAIVEEFNNKNGNDVLKAIEKADKEKNKSSVGSATVIIWNFIFVGIGTGIVLLYVNNKVNTTNHKVEEVKVFLEKTMKSNKTEEKGTTKKKQKK